ncbi:hypothetical protein GQ53DRAFT_333136 [Thozetella sp. PMI_491]|nr:hypothetical protein GQ53DRAFT_333136 [Thozetella sp. PMI_491]
MCELHFYKCPLCGCLWQGHRKLASCRSRDPGDYCPPSLCMYVGNRRRLEKNECDPCRKVREIIESLDKASDTEVTGKAPT